MARQLAALAALTVLIAGTAAGIAPPAAARDGNEKPAADNGAVVLMYHRFGNPKYPSTNVRMKQFKAQVKELAKDKYTVMPLADIVAALRNGAPLPERAVAITVDDAYKSFFNHAWPILKDAGMPVTLFAATKPIEQGYKQMMTWKQIEAVDAHNLGRVANHTHSHAHMPRQSLAANRRELKRSQALLKEHLGREPRLFSYPFGEYSRDIRKLVKKQGFMAAVGQHSGAIARTTDRLTLPRFAVNEAYGGMERFTLVANAKPLPVTDVTPKERVLTAESNPPLYGFTAHDSVNNLDGLTCYASDRGKVTRKILGDRVEVRLDSPLPEGRSRINCTMPTPSGRWRWLGAQFLVPTDAAGGE